MRGRVALLALAVVLAGCAGAFTTERPGTEPSATPSAGAATPTPTSGPPPTAGPTTGATTGPATPTPAATPTGRPPTPTPRRADRVTVAGRPLAFDEEAVYRTVLAMHGRSYDDAPPVELTVKPRPSSARTDGVFETTPFLRLWGFDASAANDTAIAGLALRRQVYLYTETVPSPTEQRVVLAHEYAHVLQYDTDAFGRVQAGVREGDGNRRQVYVAVVEGAASYVGARYAAGQPDVPARDRSWAAFTDGRSRLGTYLVAPYFFGERYVRGRIDDPANLSAVYDRPPTTTEQVIHGYEPGEEPARPLSVATETPEDSGLVTETAHPRGELFVRVLLEGQLARDRAARAAAGWGADRLVVVRNATAPGADPGYAWVLRWDDADEAEEFAAAMGTYLDRRGTRTDGRWTAGNATFDLRRVNPETVAVVAGSASFVDGVAVRGTDADVTVAVGETGAANGTSATSDAVGRPGSVGHPDAVRHLGTARRPVAATP